MTTDLAPVPEPARSSTPSVHSPGWVVGAVLLLVMATVWLLLLGPRFVPALTPPKGILLDFFKEWASARNVMTGRAAYTNQRETALLYTGYRPPETGYFEEYNAHPPTAILLALPVATLDYWTAQRMFNLASLLAGLIAAGLLAATLERRPSVLFWYGLAGWLLICDPLQQTLAQGQPNLVLLLVLTLAWRASRRQTAWGDAWAGLWTGLATCLKLYPGLLLFYFLMLGRWRALLWSVAGIIGWTAVTAAMVGPDAYPDYVTKSLPFVRSVAHNWGNLSLSAFWERLFGPATDSIRPLVEYPAAHVMLTALSAVAMLTGLAWWLRRLCTRDGQDLGFAATIVAMLLLSPTVWNHYLVLLAIPVAAVWRMTAGRPEMRYALGVCLVLVWVPLRLVWARAIPPEPGTLATHSSPALLSGKRVSGPVESITVMSHPMYAVMGIGLLSLGCGLRVERRNPARDARPGNRPATRDERKPHDQPEQFDTQLAHAGSARAAVELDRV